MFQSIKNVHSTLTTHFQQLGNGSIIILGSVYFVMAGCFSGVSTMAFIASIITFSTVVICWPLGVLCFYVLISLINAFEWKTTRLLDYFYDKVACLKSTNPVLAAHHAFFMRALNDFNFTKGLDFGPGQSPVSEKNINRALENLSHILGAQLKKVATFNGEQAIHLARLAQDMGFSIPEDWALVSSVAPVPTV